jgi:hypothetical protein
VPPIARDEAALVEEAVSALCDECQDNPHVCMRCDCGFYVGRCRAHLRRFTRGDGTTCYGASQSVRDRMVAHRVVCTEFLVDAIRIPTDVIDAIREALDASGATLGRSLGPSVLGRIVDETPTHTTKQRWLREVVRPPTRSR